MRRFRTLAFPGVILAAACTPPLDPHDPRSVANHYVAAFNAKNVKALADLSPPNEAPMFFDLIEQGEKSDSWKILFYERAVEACQAAGPATEVRKDEEGGAWVKVGETTDGRIVMVGLESQGTDYYSHGCAIMPKDIWLAQSKPS